MEDEKKQIRDKIMSQILNTINAFLRTAGEGAIRILGDTPTSVLTAGDNLGCIRQFVSKLEYAIHVSRPSAQTRFLAVNIYPQSQTKHSYFVLDLSLRDRP